MRMRLARRPPLFGGEKSTKLSPPAADRGLDFAACRRMTPAARIRPSSARRASADMRSGQRGLGPEIGPDGVSDMAAFAIEMMGKNYREIRKTQEHQYFTDSIGLRGAPRISAQCVRCPNVCRERLPRESVCGAAHELVEGVGGRLVFEFSHLPARRGPVRVEQQRDRHLVAGREHRHFMHGFRA